MAWRIKRPRGRGGAHRPCPPRRRVLIPGRRRHGPVALFRPHRGRRHRVHHGGAEDQVRPRLLEGNRRRRPRPRHDPRRRLHRPGGAPPGTPVHRAEIPGPRRHRLRRLRHRGGGADGPVVQGGGRIRRRRRFRRLRLGRRRLGHRHLQGGQPLFDPSGRVPDLRQRAHRRRPAGAGSAQAAHRLPDHLGHRQRVHRHRHLRPLGHEGEDRDRVAPPAPDPGAGRCHLRRHPAQERGRGQRL